MAEIIKKQTSEDGTLKFLLQFSDGIQIETVLMTHAYGKSLCVSSQAGCNMGCSFCASGLIKKIRDLTADEMMDQFLTVSREICKESDLEDAMSGPARSEMEDVASGPNRSETEDAASGPAPKISHVVVMGTGEPFDNYTEVLRFCDLISDPKIMGDPGLIAPRHITVSTSGIIPKIYEFAETKKRYNLAISLHAPTNVLRDCLMPVNKKYPVEELIRAAYLYSQKTKRRVAFEYLLLSGVNDSEKEAKELSELLSLEGRDASDCFYVNLIPYNPVHEFGLRGSEKEMALKFYDVLMKHGIKATLRKEHGSDISAACGQLRLNQHLT